MATSTVTRQRRNDLASDTHNSSRIESIDRIDGSRKRKASSFSNDRMRKRWFSAEGELCGSTSSVHRQENIYMAAKNDRAPYSLNRCLRDFCRHRLFVHCILWRDEHVKALRVHFRKLKLEKTEERTNSKSAIGTEMKYVTESIQSLNADVQRSGIDTLLELQGLKKMP